LHLVDGDCPEQKLEFSFVDFVDSNLHSMQSCSQAQDDYLRAKEAVLLYTNSKAGEGCLSAITAVVCAYHFPQCRPPDKPPAVALWR
jgi:hypothetical protein